MNACCGKVDVKIPSDLAPGDYLLRAEVIALHTAGQANGAQFYMSCCMFLLSLNSLPRLCLMSRLLKIIGTNLVSPRSTDCLRLWHCNTSDGQVPWRIQVERPRHQNQHSRGGKQLCYSGTGSYCRWNDQSSRPGGQLCKEDDQGCQ
jgi:hypothetical protein